MTRWTALVPLRLGPETKTRLAALYDASQRITLDLDDGVKVNYGKFGDLLAEVKAVCGTKDDE